MADKKHIVITGSTRGIGFGLARQFLKAGWNVTINGTTDQSVTNALEQLAKDASSDQVNGVAGTVQEFKDVEQLWEDAVKRFGKVDIWINNAGIDQERTLMWEMEPEEYIKVIQTNVIGCMNGSKVAFEKMLEQGGGQIFNMEGFGSNGMMKPKMTIYGTSKSAVSYFTRSLAIEAKGTPVKVGTLSPGMVATDFLKKSIIGGGAEAERNKRAFNILADDVETVTTFLARKMLETNENDARINWLTKPKVMWRFMKAPFVKRDLFK